MNKWVLTTVSTLSITCMRHDITSRHFNQSKSQVIFINSWSSAGAAHNRVPIFPRTLEDNSIYSSLTAAAVDVMTSSLLAREDSTKLSHSHSASSSTEIPQVKQEVK